MKKQTKVFLSLLSTVVLSTSIHAEQRSHAAPKYWSYFKKTVEKFNLDPPKILSH